MALGVSVVVACFNSEKVIEKTLSHLQSQENPNKIPWEVILIDNNCRDQTVVKAQSIWNENPICELRIINETEIGEANARKTGIKHAKFDIISIIDDDNRVETKWIQKVMGYYQDPNIGVVGCAGEGAFDETPPAWFQRHQLAFAIGSLYPGKFTDITAQGFAPGAGLSFRKKIFDHLFNINWQPLMAGRVGNIQSAGADSEICLIARLLGYKIYYSNDLHFQHFTLKSRITWERLEKMTAGFGQSDVFTLAYTLIFAERSGHFSILNKFRRLWWFNYYAKKAMLLFKTLKNPENEDIKLIRIRTNAFCETIVKNKQKFRDSFKIVNNYKSIV